MTFSDSTTYKIDLLNSILVRLGRQELFRNPDFVVDYEGAGYHILRVDILATANGNLPITIYLESSSIRVDINGITEAFVWPDDEVFKCKAAIEDLFLNLFTCFVILESCGNANVKSRIYLFNKNGDFVDKFAIRGFTQRFSGWDCDKRLYMPLY